MSVTSRNAGTLLKRCRYIVQYQNYHTSPLNSYHTSQVCGAQLAIHISHQAQEHDLQKQQQAPIVQLSMVRRTQHTQIKYLIHLKYSLSFGSTKWKKRGFYCKSIKLYSMKFEWYERRSNQLIPMVQNGKFSACAALFVRTLKNVDFLKM
jgi:hypothetical protein